MLTVKTIVLTIFLACPSVAAESKKVDNAVSKETWKLIEGSWIRKDFVKDVQKRRSIYAVIKAGGIDFHSSSRKSLTFEFVNDKDFGGYSVIRRAKQCWIKSLSRQEGKINLGLDSTDKDGFCSDFPKSIRLIGKGSQPQEIEMSDAVYVRDTKDRLLRAIIAGSYRDENGHDFNFGHDGNARWPDRKFRYSVANSDFEGMDSDYFIARTDTNTGQPYCFRWEGNELLISTVVSKQGYGSCSPTPIHHLKPSSPSAK